MILNLEAIDLLTSVSTLMKVVAVCYSSRTPKKKEREDELGCFLGWDSNESGEDVRTNLVGEFLDKARERSESEGAPTRGEGVKRAHLKDWCDGMTGGGEEAEEGEGHRRLVSSLPLSLPSRPSL